MSRLEKGHMESVALEGVLERQYFHRQRLGDGAFQVKRKQEYF